VNLTGKVRYTTREFASPEVLLTKRSLVVDVEPELILPAIDVYC